jgi:DHA1 family bicyclomycin/chloramphenicol resistance-like MFS transporter
MVFRTSTVPLIIPALLISGTATSILSTDLYTPSLPHLPAYFGTDASTVKLSMSLNLLGFALAQLIHGPLSDRFGRRPVLLIGMAGFLLSSIACALAASIEMLIAARALQGIMACAQAVLALAIIRDLYDESGAVKILAFHGMAIAVAPVIGPLVGGYVHVLLGWRMNFWIVSILIGIVTAMMIRYMPETVEPDRTAMAPARLLSSYGDLLARPNFLVHGLLLAGTLMGLFAFVTAAPFVFIDQMGVATDRYGYYYALVLGAFFVGNLLANRAAGRCRSRQLLRAGVAVLVAGGLALILVVYTGGGTPRLLTLAMALYLFGMALIWATSPVMAMAAAPGNAGVASAMLGTLQMAGAALGAFVVGLLHNGSAWALAIAVGAGALAVGLAYLAIPLVSARAPLDHSVK